ncbi:hypothetical protein GCM10010452_24870 [Crossiella cryophila]
MEEPHAGLDRAEVEAITQRWVRNSHRRTDDPDYPDEWYYEQCGGCRYWFPLAGQLGYDFGVCAGAGSPLVDTVRLNMTGARLL